MHPANLVEPTGELTTPKAKSNSNRLAKSYSLYSHLASNLDKIHSLNWDKFQQTSQTRLSIIYSNGWDLRVILTPCFFLPSPTVPSHDASASANGWLPRAPAYALHRPAHAQTGGPARMPPLRYLWPPALLVHHCRPAPAQRWHGAAKSAAAPWWRGVRSATLPKAPVDVVVCPRHCRQFSPPPPTVPAREDDLCACEKAAAGDLACAGGGTVRCGLQGYRLHLQNPTGGGPGRGEKAAPIDLACRHRSRHAFLRDVRLPSSALPIAPREALCLAAATVFVLTP
jgi:hypothetical protein